ncbi:MAG TPA: PIN domain-containing protein [Candidatus Dormibacteraeota bacterium]|nr:PIN domain-containing protein [Candidatus Dormibacteraeota bacterium]
MGAPGPRGLTLDTGALVAFERGDSRVRALLRAALVSGVDVAIPAGALAQAWRDGSRQARLGALVADPFTRTEPLTEVVARAAGVLCGRAGTSDVVDASVVLCARSQGDSLVVTSDADDLGLLDPQLRIVAV